MGLIVFTYFLAILLVSDSIHLFLNRSKLINKLLLTIAIPAALTATGIAVAIHLIFLQILYFQRIILIATLLCIVFNSYGLLNLAFVLPVFKRNNRLKKINILVHSLGILLIVLYVGTFQWNAVLGFTFISKEIISGIHGLQVFISLYLFVMPCFSILVLLVKFFKAKSNIYRQQLFLHSVAVILCLAIWAAMVYLLRTFSWTFALLPLGYVCLLMIDNAIFSLTRVFDLKQIVLTLIRFFLFTILFAAGTGFFTAFFMSTIRNTAIWLIATAIFSCAVLLVRDFVIKKLNRPLGKNADYEPVLDKALQNIDFTQKRESLFTQFPQLLKQYITCSGIDILISDDDMMMKTVYSDFNHTNTIDSRLPCFGYLLNENTVAITKTALISSDIAIHHKEPLIGIFDQTAMEVLILIREGQKLIGCILLARKTHSAAYNPYDMHALTNLYSYFFLIIYYLRNIAKQDIIVTVDREIEMSDQIIGSIQNYKDAFESATLAMDSVSYSAHQLGGDFIDYIKLTETRSLLLMGDVAGQGLSASMSMVVLKSIIHTYLEETTDFKTLVAKVNLFVKKNLPRGTFFAGLFGLIDFSDNTLYYINCGIPLMAMYIKNYNNVIEIQGTGRVLGFVKDITPYIKVRKITIHNGDVLAITTDGLLEGSNLKGERFGSNRVIRILQEKNTGQPLEIAHSIYNSLSDFMLQKIGDDITVLVLKHNEEKGV